MLLFDFECSQGHVHEKLVTSDTQEVPCVTCGSPAKRLISPVRSNLDVVSGDFPGATMKWAKMREKQIKHERKMNQ